MPRPDTPPETAPSPRPFAYTLSARAPMPATLAPIDCTESETVLPPLPEADSIPPAHRFAAGMHAIRRQMVANRLSKRLAARPGVDYDGEYASLFASLTVLTHAA